MVILLLGPYAPPDRGDTVALRGYWRESSPVAFAIATRAASMRFCTRARVTAAACRRCLSRSSSSLSTLATSSANSSGAAAIRRALALASPLGLSQYATTSPPLSVTNRKLTARLFLPATQGPDVWLGMFIVFWLIRTTPKRGRELCGHGLKLLDLPAGMYGIFGVFGGCE